MATYDTWGGSWGTDWALSWTRDVPVPPAVVEGATPGFIRGVYDYYKRRSRDEREPERPVPTESANDEAIREYTERSELLTRAIEKLRGESEAIKAETADLRSRIERASSRKALARLDSELMLREQAATLAQAQEAALLEEMEMNDVIGVALIALAYIRQ